MTRRRRTLVIAAALVVSAVGGCAWTDDNASSALRADMPRLITDAGFAAIPDWRWIGDPTEDMRASFAHDGVTYRVIDSGVDDATLAIWRTGPQGAQPMFNETIVATGSACVELHRKPDAVSASVVDCPVPLSETPPWHDDLSWGQDAKAVTATTRAISGTTERVRRLMILEPDGRPRSTDRTLTDIAATAEDDDPTSDVTVLVSDLRQDGRMVTLSLTATATTAEAVDTTRTATARWCAQLRVDLDDRNPNSIGDEGPCP